MESPLLGFYFRVKSYQNIFSRNSFCMSCPVSTVHSVVAVFIIDNHQIIMPKRRKWIYRMQRFSRIIINIYNEKLSITCEKIPWLVTFHLGQEIRQILFVDFKRTPRASRSKSRSRCQDVSMQVLYRRRIPNCPAWNFERQFAWNLRKVSDDRQKAGKSNN